MKCGDELSDCPFCGSENVEFVDYKDGEVKNACYVECNNCKGRGPLIPSSRRLAKALWNKSNNGK